MWKALDTLAAFRRGAATLTDARAATATITQYARARERTARGIDVRCRNPEDASRIIRAHQTDGASPVVRRGRSGRLQPHTDYQRTSSARSTIALCMGHACLPNALSLRRHVRSPRGRRHRPPRATKRQLRYMEKQRRAGWTMQRDRRSLRPNRDARASITQGGG